MKVNQYHFSENRWNKELPSDDAVTLVFAFGCRKLMKHQGALKQLGESFPNAHIVGCTTSGEITGTDILDDSVVATAIKFERTKVDVQSINLKDYKDLSEAVQSLAYKLSVDDLKSVLILSDGQLVNGTTLVAEMTKSLPEGVLITGGLAGDKDEFNETEVWHNGDIGPGRILACGFYGNDIVVGSGSYSGWKSFGPERLITKASGNLLYELDGQSALALYKQYLGDYAEQLPASALRFPLSVRNPETNETLIRTILNIDEGEQSLTFAGDVPEGSYAQLMRANIDNLIDGAQEAAQKALQDAFTNNEPEFGLLISCVGRRLVLQQETEYELESIEEMIPKTCKLAGFYSYGEISPTQQSRKSALHNQTMTITFFSES